MSLAAIGCLADSDCGPGSVQLNLLAELVPEWQRGEGDAGSAWSVIAS